MTEWNQWVQSEKEALAEVMERHGIEWEQKGTHEKHLSVLDFEKKQRAEEVEKLNAEIESAKTDLKAVEKQLNQTVPKLKNSEKLAVDFPEDVDKLLPEASAFESAKNYREKKATPVFEKAVGSSSHCITACLICKPGIANYAPNSTEKRTVTRGSASITRSCCARMLS